MVEVWDVTSLDPQLLVFLMVGGASMAMRIPCDNLRDQAFQSPLSVGKAGRAMPRLGMGNSPQSNLKCHCLDVPESEFLHHGPMIILV